MKLRLRKFEKAMRPRVRQELRKSPSAWREFRRVRRRWWSRDRNISPWFFRFFPPLALLGFWGGSGGRTDGLVALTLFILFATLAWRSGQLLIALRTSPRLFLYAHLPLSDEQIFGLQWKFFLRTSAWSIVDFTVFYGALASEAGYGWNCFFVGLAMAVAQWLAILSGAAALVAYVRNRRLFDLAVVFALVTIASLFFPSSISLGKTLAAFATWIPPMGWILYSMGISPPHGVLLEWWAALSFAAALFSLPLFYQRLRRTFVMPEWAVANESKRAAVEAWRRARADGSNPDAFSGITSSIRRRDFLKGFDWSKAGWVERFAASWLTPQERAAAEFLSGGDPKWTRRLKQFGLFLVGLAVLAGIAPRFLLAALGPFASISLLVLMSYLHKNGWPGTTLRKVGGSNISVCSTYPLTFWQIARIIIKTNLVWMLTLALFLAAGAFVFVGLRRFDFAAGVIISIKILSAILGLALLTPIMLVTSGTNDGSKWRTVVITILWSPACIGAAIFLLVAWTWITLMAAAGLLIGVCAAALAIYGHAYSHGWFDLQSKPRETLTARSQ